MGAEVLNISRATWMTSDARTSPFHASYAGAAPPPEPGRHQAVGPGLCCSCRDIGRG